MKKLLTFLCILTLAMVCLFVLPTPAKAFSEGSYTYSLVNGHIVTIIDYSGSENNLTIPATLGGFPVSKIGDSAFSDCDNLTSVTIPNGVTSIGDSAFSNCDNLTTVTIPNSVSTIGDDVFSHCYRLISVTIPDRVTTIGNSMFSNCRSLTSVTIPENVTAIGAYAFRNCESLTSITIPSSVNTIGTDAFDYCYSLSDVNITDLSTWCRITFSSVCSNPIVYGENLYIDGKLVTDIMIPNDVTFVGDYAFASFENLMSVDIPDSVTAIGNSAFRNCDRLTLVSIPDSVTSIGEYAFYACESLDAVTVGNGVTIIGGDAFSYCKSLTKVNITDLSAWCSITFRYADSNPLYYAKNLYLNGLLVTDVIIPDGVATVSAYAFSQYTKLTSLTIPESVTAIGFEAFGGCQNLKNIYYASTNEQWKKISIASNNSYLAYLKIHYSHIHDFTQIAPVVMKPTCNKMGYTKYTCVYGEEHIYYTEDAWGHDYTDKIVIEKATCEEGGYSGVKCNRCNEVRKDTIIDALGHLPVVIPAKDANCTEEGYTKHTQCDRCKKKLVQPTVYAPLGHNYTKKVTRSTCTTKGYTTYTCDCGDSYQDNYTNAKGHTYSKGKCAVCAYKPAGAKITAHPVNVAVANGKTAKVTIKATGTGLKYTWYYAKKGAKTYTKAASTTNSYSLKMSSSYDGTKVYCVVSDAYGNAVKSSVVTLYKGTPAKITTQPKSITVANGKTGKLELKASGTGLKYTWYIKYKGATTWTKVGSSSNTYSFKMASKLNGAQAYCAVTDKYGITVKSSVVTIKMPAQPKITTQPKSVTQVSGKTVKFTVKASGEGLKYQWYYAKKGSSSFKKLSGKTSATYSVKVSSSVNGRKYYCLVTDKYGQTVKSSAVTLTLKTVAKITTQPKSVTVKNGSTAKVTIKAVGDGLTYNWYYLKPGATKYTKASITKNVFSVKMAAAWKNAKVYCVIADKYGNTVKSKVVILKMK